MKPRIATPISTLFKTSEDAEAILALSDCLECRDFSLDTPYPNQELFHCDLELTQPWSEQDRAYIQKAFHGKNLRVLSFHSARCCSGHEILNGMFQLSGTIYSRSDLLANAEVNVMWLKSILPSTCVVALENNNYHPTPAYDIVTDGDFLSEVVERNGINFLLDIAHAHITAHNRGMAYETYLASLPLDHVIQLHLCKYRLGEAGLAEDAHMAPGNDEFVEMQSVLATYPGVEYVTIEYYKELPGLVQSLQNLRSHLENH